MTREEKFEYKKANVIQIDPVMDVLLEKFLSEVFI